MGVELVLALGFSDIGPERDSPGVLDQQGPMGVAQGKGPEGSRGESRRGMSKGKVQAQISPRGRASTVSLGKRCYFR